MFLLRPLRHNIRSKSVRKTQQAGPEKTARGEEKTRTHPFLSPLPSLPLSSAGKAGPDGSVPVPSRVRALCTPRSCVYKKKNKKKADPPTVRPTAALASRATGTERARAEERGSGRGQSGLTPEFFKVDRRVNELMRPDSPGNPHRRERVEAPP